MRYIIKLQNIIIKNFTKQQAESVDSDNEDIFAQFQTVEAAVKIHTLHGVHNFPFNVTYIHPMEPDGSLLKLWIRGHTVGPTKKDLSGFDHTVNEFGEPGLVDGIIDLGTNTIGVKSIATRFNRPTSDSQNEEYISVADASDIQTDALVTGFSEFMRFKVYDLDNQSNEAITLWEKIDDSAGNDGRKVIITDTGRIKVQISDNNVDYVWQTAINTILRNTATSLPYDLWITYNASTHAVKLYLDGVDTTLTTTTAFSYHDQTSDHDIQIFRRGGEGGYVYGDFYDYRMYAEKIVSQTEVTRLHTNKWSISNIAFGAVAIVDHMATYTGSGGTPDPSFTTTSFTTTSFTT